MTLQWVVIRIFFRNKGRLWSEAITRPHSHWQHWAWLYGNFFQMFVNYFWPCSTWNALSLSRPFSQPAWLNLEMQLFLAGTHVHVNQFEHILITCTSQISRVQIEWNRSAIFETDIWTATALLCCDDKPFETKSATFQASVRFRKRLGLVNKLHQAGTAGRRLLNPLVGIPTNLRLWYVASQQILIFW